MTIKDDLATLKEYITDDFIVNNLPRTIREIIEKLIDEYEDGSIKCTNCIQLQSELSKLENTLDQIQDLLNE